MRFSPISGLSLLIALIGTQPTLAADAKGQQFAEASSAQSLSSTNSHFLSELRFGFSAEDPWGSEGRGGSANLTGEILFAKPFSTSDLFTSYFIPRPHVGGSANFDGGTSFAYAGLTWTVDITPSLFVEGSFGGAFHNNTTSPFFVPRDRQSLGCSPLFRESGSVGVRLAANWSVMATVEHMSNGTCSDNRGLTNIGARIGYSF